MGLAQTILVAAPGRDLRESLVFALEADGFQVSAHSQLTEALASAHSKAAACIVVDEKAVDNSPEGHAQLGGLGRPLVLLVDALAVIPEVPRLRVLTKPLLGRLLIETVRLGLSEN